MQRPDINKLKELNKEFADYLSNGSPRNAAFEAKYLAAFHSANLIEYVEELEQKNGDQLAELQRLHKKLEE